MKIVGRKMFNCDNKVLLLYSFLVIYKTFNDLKIVEMIMHTLYCLKRTGSIYNITNRKMCAEVDFHIMQSVILPVQKCLQPDMTIQRILCFLYFPVS